MRRLRDWLCVGFSALACASATAQSTERVSVDSNGAEANGRNEVAVISADGRFVAFASYATNLVAQDTNGCIDVFVRDRQAGTTELVSVDSNGAQGNGINTWVDAISSSGHYVVFTSDGTSLVPGDTNGCSDVFLRDLRVGTTERVSLDSNGTEGNHESREGSVSSDGRYVAFTSDADQLVPGDTNGWSDVFVRDRLSGTTERISVNTGGAEGNRASSLPSISGDGRFVAFLSDATNLVSGDQNGHTDVFVRDRATGTTIRVSGPGAGTGDALSTQISADGRFVVYCRLDNTGFNVQCYVHDAPTDSIVLVSDENGHNFLPSITTDGRYVAYESDDSWLVPGDTNGALDIFRYDLQMDRTERVSLDSAGAQGDAMSFAAMMSADGRSVVFVSAATNLVPGDANGEWDIFVRTVAPEGAHPFCFGDGAATPCPCGTNHGRLFRGCQNSDFTDGAFLTADGNSSLAQDTLRITCLREKGQALSAFFQGDAVIAATNFGDGLRCVGGTMNRLYVRHAFGGVVSAPEGAEPSFSARSAALNDPISAGATRYYQVMYRDPAVWHCPDPPGSTWNVSTALSVVWNP